MRIFSALLLAAFIVCSTTAFSAEKTGMGTINGKITMKDGVPLSGGKVCFFRDDTAPIPSQSRYWRTPDEITTIDDKGTFTASLKEGKYYISATRKLSKDLIGPPVEGDYVYPDSRKDLKDEQMLYSVNKGKITDIGTIAEAVPFRKKTLTQQEGTTAIEGTILDSEGKPVSGAIALAFLSSNVIGKPYYVSERTGKDGKYSLRVAEGATYYIKIRTTLIGGHPESDEIIGIYGKDTPLPVKVTTGKITTGIDVTGKTFKYQKQNKPFEKQQLNQKD